MSLASSYVATILDLLTIFKNLKYIFEKDEMNIFNAKGNNKMFPSEKKKKRLMDYVFILLKVMLIS